MKICNLKCPQCSEVIGYELDRDSMFCKYCGKVIFKNEITLDKVISSIDTEKDEAQEYYERWLSLRDSLYLDTVDHKIRKAFNDFDKMYRIKFPNDYRRMYCDVLTITQNFKGIETFNSIRAYYGEDDDAEFYKKYVDTWITYGGSGKKHIIVELQSKIKRASKDPQAIEMVKRIQKHIDEVMDVAEAQCITSNDEVLAPGKHMSKNLIKRELREKPNEKKKGIRRFF